MMIFVSTCLLVGSAQFHIVFVSTGDVLSELIALLNTETTSHHMLRGFLVLMFMYMYLDASALYHQKQKMLDCWPRFTPSHDCQHQHSWRRCLRTGFEPCHIPMYAVSHLSNE